MRVCHTLSSASIISKSNMISNDRITERDNDATVGKITKPKQHNDSGALRAPSICLFASGIFSAKNSVNSESSG